MPGATAPTLDEPRTGRLTIQYAPDAETPIVENPPRFTWLPVIEDEALYLLRLSQDQGDLLTFEPQEESLDCACTD